MENTETKAVPVQEIAAHNMRSILGQIDQVLLGMVSLIGSSNGVKEVDKRKVAAALKNAIIFSLDFGVNTTNVKLFEEGSKYYNENHVLSALMAKAIDTKMMLLAIKQDEQEKETASSTPESLNEIEKQLGE